MSLVDVRDSWKKRLAGFMVLASVLVALTGILFFLMALAPCRFRLEPGTLVSYRLVTELRQADASGVVDRDPFRSSTEQVQLICLSEANEVALVSPGGSGQRDEVTLLRFEENGTVRRLDPALRLLPDGKALGLFDFNLLPLPTGLDQRWRVSVLYAVPPPGHRHIDGTVQRVANGLRPEFELKLKTVEWLDKQQGVDRWRQLRDITCRYRYDTSQGIVDEARLSMLAGFETEAGLQYYQVSVQLAGAVVQQGRSDGVADLRDLALATAQAQVDIEQGRRSRVRDQLARLLPLEGDADGPLHALARHLLADSGLEGAAAAPGTWSLQLCSVALAREEHLRALAGELLADGYPAQVVRRGDRVALRLGPYAERKPELLQVFRDDRRFRTDQPLWVQEAAGAGR